MSTTVSRAPLVAIVGRPNVGKSTLFNKITGRRRAITEETAGVTRDRIYGFSEWNGVGFDLVDTGGLEFDATRTGGTAKNKNVARAMLDHAFRAVEEADAVVALFDAVEGLTAVDREVLKRLRALEKPVFYAANKVDSSSREQLQYEFYEAGVEKVYPVSAEHGRGVGDLLDDVVAVLPRVDTETAETRDETHRAANLERIRVSVVGRPNVGKSSLVNRMLGYERVIVSEMAGTTRDAVDTALLYQDREYLLIDTAGIRRKARVNDKLEKFSVVKALDAIGRCDVAVLVMDAIEGVHEQEAKIAGEIDAKGRAALIVLNKWDLAFANEIDEAAALDTIRRTIKFMPWAPVLKTSAVTGHNVPKILEAAAACFEQYTRRLPTPKLNKWLAAATEAHPPPATPRGPVNMNFATTAGTRPPQVVIFTNHPDAIHFSYQRYLENSLREEFGLQGTPVRITFKKKKGKPKR